MKEIYPRLFIGNEIDYERQVKYEDDWKIIHACKDPYHRNTLGYKGRGAPKEHPEYYFAKRPNKLILNIVDAPKPEFIPKVIMDESLRFIDNNLKNENKVLVHCNQGESRSPGIGLLYLAVTKVIAHETFDMAEREFVKRYPYYNPGRGVRGFLKLNWVYYTMEFKVG